MHIIRLPNSSQGIAWNPATGDLWEDEHGTQGGDEVNLVKAGKNYGWPVVAYGCEYTCDAAVATGTLKD